MQHKNEIGLLKRVWRKLFGYKGRSTTLYHPLAKYYLFNETGNILICSSAESIKGFDDYIKNAFTDVSVFLAAMTKALASLKDKDSGQAFSIYNYQAIKNMFLHSNMFIETNAEHGYLISRKVGESLGKKFVQVVLNRDFDERSLPFTRGMFNGMKYQENSKYENILYQRGGHVFFICELLNGLPTTSVVLVSIEPISGVADENNVGAELKRMPENKEIDILTFGSKQEKGYTGSCKRIRTWRFRKRSYLFVPPNYLKNAKSINDPSNLEDYEELVFKLGNSISKHVAKSKKE